VHRSRLFAQHLPEFGWIPIILTVDERYYEETLDDNLVKLLPPELRIEKVKAFKTTKPRMIGDIGLRAFFQLYRKAKKIINKEEVKFLYIPIPSFYSALLGRLLRITTNIKYGIDYIDPWVHHFPGSEVKFSRHWWSSKLSAILEPIAIKKASLITGVAEGYYEGVKNRNPSLINTAVFGSMPYGGEILDHFAIKTLKISPYLFKKETNKIKLVYAGALLPKAFLPMETLFRVIQNNLDLFKHIEIHFIGTGKTPNDINGYNVKALAEKYGIWNTIIYEYPSRIPYLDVLSHLEAADGVFILGSTEPHYTPSKVYQAVLAQKPVLALLHQSSTAVRVILDSKAGIVLPFDGKNYREKIQEEFPAKFQEYIELVKVFDPSSVIMGNFDQNSAKEVTRQLVVLLEKSLEK